GVQGDCDATDFGASTRRRDAACEITAGDCIGGAGNSIERSQPDSPDPPRERRECRERSGGDDQLGAEEARERRIDVVERYGDDDAATVCGAIVQDAHMM